MFLGKSGPNGQLLQKGKLPPEPVLPSHPSGITETAKDFGLCTPPIGWPSTEFVPIDIPIFQEYA